MSAPLAPLPMDTVAAAYKAGESYQTLGDRYGVSASTIRNRLRTWAREREVDWPLRLTKENVKQRPNVVSSDIVKQDIAKTCRRFHISQLQLAELAGVSVNLLYKISGGFSPRIFRSTQGKILEACSKLYAGEVVLEPVKQLTLPMHARDVCTNGHQWRGQRWPNGARKCNQCVAAKHARADAKRKQKRTVSS